MQTVIDLTKEYLQVLLVTQHGSRIPLWIVVCQPKNSSTACGRTRSEFFVNGKKFWVFKSHLKRASLVLINDVFDSAFGNV